MREGAAGRIRFHCAVGMHAAIAAWSLKLPEPEATEIQSYSRSRSLTSGAETSPEAHRGHRVGAMATQEHFHHTLPLHSPNDNTISYCAFQEAANS